ncbi:MAG TPA: PAS domain S-box protein, partial [Thermoplasmatales archaeon]|nr:PAS domain S-box protein [Thermoplasmatales archaeon]
RVIGESARDAIIMLDYNGNICYWNKAAEEMFGYKEEEVIGRNLYGLITPNSLGEKHVEAFSRFQETGKLTTLAGRTLEVPAKKRDGTEFIMEMSLSAAKIGGKWHAIGIIRDITDRKQMEKKLKEKIDELERYKKLTVGRELRMIELKQRIKELEEEIRKLQEEKKT